MKFWKELLYYTRSEQRGIIAMMVLIAIGLFLVPVVERWGAEDVAVEADSVLNGEVEQWIASLRDRDSIARQRYEKRQKGRSVRKVYLQTFDPNSADSAMLVSLGLQPWMASNILKYREKGGRFRKADDFRKVYGLTEEQYLQLEPYIDIPEVEVVPVYKEIPIYREPADSVFKYREPTQLPINISDTTELKKIPGVGSRIANMIVGYRSKLGGYYSVEQLADIRLNVDILRHWLVEDTVPMRVIKINRSSIDRMRSHPYIDYRQAQAIHDYRVKRGDIHSFDELSLIEEFSEKDIERLSHYVSFE